MSLLAAVLWIVATVLYHIVDRIVGQSDASWMAWQPSDAISVACVAVSLALFFYSRRSSRYSQFILNLGLGYMVFMSLAVGLIWHWDPVDHRQDTMPLITWVGAIVLMFAATLPSTPTKMLVAGLIAVSMNPVGMLDRHDTAASGSSAPPINVAGHALSRLPARRRVGGRSRGVVTRLGQQVAKAREMGSYQLGELIGRGGMGEVYRATHRMLARPAAIKLIRPERVGGG